MNFYKHALLCILLIGFFTACNNTGKQEPAAADSSLIINNKKIIRPEERKNSFADVDVSPMDMSYYPNHYPQFKMSHPDVAPPVMRVIYSRPHLQGRELFHDILKYNEPWRLGANEASELDVFRPVKIEQQILKEGRYTLYAIPQEDSWVIAINQNLDSWGLKMDSTKDILRTRIPVTHQNPHLEYFTMVFEKTDTGANLLMGWADVVAKLPFTFSEN